MTKKKLKHKGSWWSNQHRRYKHQDKKKGFSYDLTLDQAKALMLLPCYFCGHSPSKGLDRIDNSQGHTLNPLNIVSCCTNCNMLLGQVTWEMKLELRDGLRQIREKGLYNNWHPAYCPPYRPKDKSKDLSNEDIFALDLDPNDKSDIVDPDYWDRLKITLEPRGYRTIKDKNEIDRLVKEQDVKVQGAVEDLTVDENEKIASMGITVSNDQVINRIVDLVQRINAESPDKKQWTPYEAYKDAINDGELHGTMFQSFVKMDRFLYNNDEELEQKLFEISKQFKRKENE